VSFGKFTQLYFGLFAHTQYSLYFGLTHRKQPRRLYVFHWIYLYWDALKLFLFFPILILIILNFEGICKDRLIRVSWRMGDFEDLFWALTKLIYLAFDSHFLNWVFYALNVNHSLVSKRVKEIKRFDCLLSSLLVAKNQINPFMKIVRHILRL